MHERIWESMAMINEDGRCFAIEHRAYYLDQTRGRVCHISELKKFIDKLAFYGYNEFQIYIEHTYLFKRVPELSEGESYFTAEDIKELDRYCRDRGIEFIPSLSSFGHLYKLLRTEKYRHLSEITDDNRPFSFIDRMQHHTMEVADDEGLLLIEDMLLEYMSLFSSDKVNICCDETFDLCSDRSKALLEKRDKLDIYIDYVSKLCDFVVENGKIPMIWGDVIAGNSHLFKRLPKETICLSWGYGVNESDANIKKLSDCGISQYVCPGVCGWNYLINKIHNSYINLKTMVTFSYKHGTNAVMVTDWGDYGHINHPLFSIPGMAMAAAFMRDRNNLEKDFETICQEISAGEYGDNSGRAVKCLSDAADSAVYTWSDIVRLYDNRLSDDCNGNGKGCLKYEVKRVLDEERLLIEADCMLSSCKEIARDAFDPSFGKIVLNAMEGIGIMNHVCAAILDGKHEPDTALLLERWFDEYRDIFLQNSGESDLHYVQDIIKWCTQEII